jgi:hypothetical protein
MPLDALLVCQDECAPQGCILPPEVIINLAVQPMVQQYKLYCTRGALAHQLQGGEGGGGGGGGAKHMGQRQLEGRAGAVPPGVVQFCRESVCFLELMNAFAHETEPTESTPALAGPRS